mmetsp:Transcript_8805/g.11071  ORF Transcript_8805/g.11071 Transcript_8805/m.11071 type:complete len:1292 (+) Transcript_8805:46-3921(+)
MSFPTQSLLPKTETKAQLFVDDNPRYDGTGVTIGILDTGVDPGAIGLSRLPDGSRKLVHVADCTGSGDVSMNIEAHAVKEEKGWIIKNSLIDNEIVLNPGLTLKSFPSEKGKGGIGDDETTNIPVRLGFKRAYELFPKKLTTRVKKYYKTRFMQQQHCHAVTVHRELAAFTEKVGEKELTKEQIREKEDITARLELLENKSGDSDPLHDDPGTLLLIVLFFDGENYRVLVDTEGTGDMSALPLSFAMTDYYKEGQYGTFSHVDMCNYAVNIYQDGKVVSIVVDAGAHGSHVAGITARYHATSSDSDEEPNGVAPGAKLVSLKIGDSRLGSMETGTALTRALIEAVKHKCDVINLSYGEGCCLPNNGRFIELAEELVYKHGIVFVSSAGNNGPALTTVGAPGGTSDAIIGVAAYVSPTMMSAEYSALKDDNEGTTYTWSSVGPTADGAQGVDIMAPGAAITCVPNWCLQRNQLMNGTSMSSPNATGCIALLLSAAKAEGTQMTPSRLKRALINCADSFDGLSCLQQGWGMINVDKTWGYIKQFQNNPFQDINFKVNVSGRPGKARGVYLRQTEDTRAKQTFAADVNPIFGNEDSTDLQLQRKRIEFEMKIRLEVDASWVEAPEFFMLMHNGRSFKFNVDPTKLEPGHHTAKILGFDATKPGLGPQFYVPITVVKPIDQSTLISLGELEFETNEVKRYFLDVPSGVSWMDVTVKDCRDTEVEKETSSRLMVLHTIQLLPHKAYRDAQVQKYLNLLPSQETVTSVPVHPGVTCELDLARYWSAQGVTKLNVKVEFRGVASTPDVLTFTSGGGGARTRLHSYTGNQHIKPDAKLTKWQTALNPKSHLISPCDERDILPETKKQIHQLVLTYEFEQKEKGSFTPRLPALQGYLYESAFESQMIMIFDQNKKCLGVADSWPDEVHAPEGKVTLRLQVRHDNVQKLELLKETTLWIERKLSSPLSLSAYESHSDMVSDGRKFGRMQLRKGLSVAVFFKEPNMAKLPSECKDGDIMIGVATYEDQASSLPGATHKPGGTEIKFIIGTKFQSKDKNAKAKAPESPDERSLDEKIEEEIKSVKVDELKKLMDKDNKSQEIEEYSKKLMKQYPDHLPLLMAMLRYYDKKDSRSEKLQSIIDTADLVINQVDQKELAAHFGSNHDEEDPKSTKERKVMEEKKTFLIEALARKSHAKVKYSDEEFNDSLKHLLKWVNVENDKKYAVLCLEKYKRSNRLGLMIKLLTSLLENKGKDTNDGIFPLTYEDIIKERITIFRNLDYTHLVERDEAWLRISTTTKDYALF